MGDSTGFANIVHPTIPRNATPNSTTVSRSNCKLESTRKSQAADKHSKSMTYSGNSTIKSTRVTRSDRYLWLLIVAIGASFFFAWEGRSQPGNLTSCGLFVSASTESYAPHRANMTLRQFLLNDDGIHLGMAPAFFGYNGYFGALAAWDEELSNSSFPILKQNIKSVAGASAGAMAAVLIASGVPPRKAADFCSSISLRDFADPPGLFSVFRGDKFEELMHNFMVAENPESSFQLEDSIIPVSVSGFDLLSMEGKLLTRGSMARAARASACFPILFQPVGWLDGESSYLFADGGITDYFGLNGLGAFRDTRSKKRVVNLVVGGFPFGRVPGPSSMPNGVDASEVVSISIRGLPKCGPWAMENGPLAVDVAQRAMKAALDQPMSFGNEEGHYELHIDASSYLPPRKE
eukprot:scaffold4329_cov115-Cylindrotheca_fusiformis.AAC.8